MNKLILFINHASQSWWWGICAQFRRIAATGCRLSEAARRRGALLEIAGAADGGRCLDDLPRRLPARIA